MSTGSSLSVAVLAGGQSRRMGRDKALLELGGSPLIERVLAAVAPLNAHRMLLAGDPAPFDHLGLPVHADLRADSGPLGGLHTALSLAPSPIVLLLACDLPFVTVDFLRFLLAARGDHQVLVPRDADGLHPLCAVYTRSCLPAVERALDRGDRRMRAFHDEVDVRVVESQEWRDLDPRDILLANLNTPEDYRRACELAGVSPP